MPAPTTGLSPSPAGLNRAYGSPARKERAPDNTVFGYEGCPDIPALHRDVYRWVQSLDLSHSLKNVRRDVANGFLVAEIFSRHYPLDIQMHGFANATSSHYKRDNWQQLQRFCLKQGLSLPSDLVEGTAAGLHGAGIALLEHLYELFTNKRVPHLSIPAGALSGTLTMPTGSGLGGGPADTASKGISAAVKVGAGIDFGVPQTSLVAGDAMALRKKLAAEQQAVS